MTLRALRVYHGGRDPAHRLRERALVAAGVDVTLVVPRQWPDGGAEDELSSEPFPTVELDVGRAGDVNRHKYADISGIQRILRRTRPDVLDLHEEPFSVAARQWLMAADLALPVVAYAAQNVDKRWPPPFAQWEKAAFRRLSGLYPCTRQAASVARGKGFAGLIEVLPLGYDPALLRPGNQSLRDPELVLGLIGRLVPEKGVSDAVQVLADLRRDRPARLHVIGSGPAEAEARALARRLRVEDAMTLTPWQRLQGVADAYRQMHVVLVPSRATQTWVEQFGRVIVEAQAAGAVVAGYASGAINEVGAAALLVQEGDVRALSRAVVDLVSDEERYAAARARAMESVRGLTWEAVAGRQRSFYERVVAGSRPMALPSAASSRRAFAEREFGPPAVLAEGVRRPFALPVLRSNRWWTRAFGRGLDAIQR